MTCFPPCLLSFLSHHNHHHDILKNTKKQRHFFKKKENWKGKENKKNEKTPNLSFGCELPEKLTRRALILDANSGCGGRPGPPRVYLGPRQCHKKKNRKKTYKKSKKREKTPNLSFGCAEPEKLTRRAVILDANSGCGGRPGPPREYFGL